MNIFLSQRWNINYLEVLNSYLEAFWTMKSSHTTLKLARFIIILGLQVSFKYIVYPPSRNSPVRGEGCTPSSTKPDFICCLSCSTTENKHLYFCPQKCQGDLCGLHFVSVAYLMLQCTPLTTWKEKHDSLCSQRCSLPIKGKKVHFKISAGKWESNFTCVANQVLGTGGATWWTGLQPPVSLFLPLPSFNNSFAVISTPYAYTACGLSSRSFTLADTIHGDNASVTVWVFGIIGYFSYFDPQSCPQGEA